MLKLRKTEPGEPLVLAMTAVRMGDRLLVIGCSEPKVVAQLATRPGLTGRACAVDAAAEHVAKAAEAAQNEGALLEAETAPVSALPFAAADFDVVVISHALPQLPESDRAACLAEAARVLRAGGRCLVIQPGRRSGLASLFGGATAMTTDEVHRVMEGAGFRAVQTLAERQGLAFVEGARR
jgi:ubiquinone/menaquinone biosynthesis C-methylase UbiE